MGAEMCGLGVDRDGWVSGGGGGVVCRRGLRRGAVSRPFRAAELLRALPVPPHGSGTVSAI